jgi:hypothetical protein
LDRIGLINILVNAVHDIDFGRKGFATVGKEGEGRVFYEQGIAAAFSIFKEVQTVADPEFFMLAESAYSEQELEFCNEADTYARGSLTQAIRSFDDALRSVKVVKEKASYRKAEMTYPTDPKKRIQGCPKDAFHLACSAHITRLQNSLRTPGVNMIEKAAQEQRISNMKTAATIYFKLHKSALGI